MSRIKKAIDDNPIAVLAGVVVGAATLAGSVTGWFWKQSDDLRELQYKTELDSTRSKLEDRISDLSVRLASIERRVGESKVYLDVLKIPIVNSDISVLPASYRSFSSGSYFASVPKSDLWTETPASQIDLIIAMLGESSRKMAEMTAKAIPIMSEKSGILWKSSQVVDAKLAPSPFTSMGEFDKLQLHPYLFIMQVDESYMEKTGRQVARAIDDASRDNVDLAKELAKISQPPVRDNKNGQIPETPDAAKKGNAKAAIARDVDFDEGFLNTLASVSRDDLAGLVLIDSLISRLQFSILANGSLKVLATQKKGNVCYVRTQLILPTISGPESKPITSKTVLDEELFFIGTSRGGLMIRSGVPTTNMKSDAYAWTTAMLSSLRVLVD